MPKEYSKQKTSRMQWKYLDGKEDSVRMQKIKELAKTKGMSISEMLLSEIYSIIKETN